MKLGEGKSGDQIVRLDTEERGVWKGEDPDRALVFVYFDSQQGRLEVTAMPPESIEICTP